MELLEALQKEYKVSKLRRLTGLSPSKLEKELKKLIKENKIIYIKRHNEYHLLREGKLSLKNELFGFITPLGDEGAVDVYVNIKSLNGARDEDKVLYYTYEDYYKNELRNYSVIVKILERGKKEFVGILKTKTTKSGEVYYLVDVNAKADFKPILDPKDMKNLVPGMILRVALNYQKSKVFASLIEIVGNIDDPGIEISTIAASYGFTANFPLDVKEEVSNISQIVLPNEYNGRTDFRNLDIITIDGDDSKDFDDAINVRKLENGNFLLGVYIADVSNYVKFDSSLDVEAYKRGTSVYLADRVIPMLPHELSNGICSLNEGVDRLVLAITMEIDHKANCLNYKIEEGIIKSKHRMTYNKVNAILKGDENLIREYHDIYQMLLDMNELHDIIREKREKNGGLEFEVDEYKFSLNLDGSPKDIVLRTRDEAEKLIEDFMVTANEMVAYHLAISELPCLYRIHEKPDQDKLKNVFNMLTHAGISIKFGKNDIHPKQIQDALTKINDTPKAAILNQLLLRSMMKAKYQPENLGHYGLALRYYCHFTSPIRRYPDLIVHRIIKELIIHPNNFDNVLKWYQNNLVEVGLKTSNSERRSIECEREVNDMLQAWYMESRKSRIFKGMITSITNFGIFVTLENGIEGLIHVRDMAGYANYNEKDITMDVDGKLYSLGDIIDIYVLSSDRKEKKVNFLFASDAAEFNLEVLK